MKKLLLFLVLILNLSHLYSQSFPDAEIEEDHIITNKGYILYASPDSEYANVIEVGVGKQYEEIHNIPLSDLVKNTLIKIFYREEPYRTRVFVDVIGNENEKIRFQGIPNEEEILPVITFENATSWGNTIDSTLETGSAFVVLGTWSNKPAWIDIVNLHIKDAPYAGIWAKGDHISVKGCILENNANGVFFQAANQLLIEISTYILIEGCKFLKNGTINGWLHHNIYTQGMHTLIQFNNIEQLKDEAFGASLKDRSSHTTIRYNKINTSARTLDLVEPEDTNDVLTSDANWDDVYVYGNLLVNKKVPVNGAGVNMIHYGYDNSPTYRREGVLYFYNNTVVVERSDNPWRVNIFDVNSTNSKVEFSNNIVYAKGMQTFYVFRSNNTDNAGDINFGKSFFSIHNTQNNWELTEGSGSYNVSGQENIDEGDNPGFVNMENENYNLTSNSPCVNNGENLNQNSGLNINFNSIKSNIEMYRSDQTSPSLGSFSYNSTASIKEESKVISFKLTAVSCFLLTA